MKNLRRSFTLTITVSLLIALNSAGCIAAQNKYDNFSWISPNDWEGAIFDVPTWFARDMRYTGREVIRFHDGFYDQNSVGFWTYAFGLLIDQTEIPTTQALIDETHRYFTGLARELGDNKDENYPASNIILSPKSNWVIEDNGKRRSQLFELQSYDSFTTGAPIKLNVKITTWLCSNNHRAIHYAISPHETTHPVWNQLDKEIHALKCW